MSPPPGQSAAPPPLPPAEGGGAHAPPSWRLATFDPPEDDEARTLADFMRGQRPPGTHYPEEKREIFRWKLAKNPAHHGFASAMIAGPEERVVSLCTVTPKRLWARGREVPWAEIGDTFTDERFLRKGMFSALVNASRERAQRAGFALVYGLPNAQSRPGYVDKLGFAIKDDLPLRTYALPLGTRALASRPFAATRPRLKALLSNPFAAFASRLATGALLAPFARRRPAVLVAPEPAVGPDFDDLWRAARDALPYAQVRDVRHLAWRFEQNPFPFVLLGARARGRLVGYLALVTVHASSTTGVRQTFVVDWLVHPEDAPTYARALLAGALRHAVGVGADLVTSLSSTVSPQPLPFTAFGFLSRPTGLPVIVHENDEGRALLADRAPFHFTLADTDTF
ncbi:MAG: GNAT family N-acetyltransferase [Polyangiaceae bacterium]|nr:GNAT family N-acetyltransferase [Polyangiaceae bacterium]